MYGFSVPSGSTINGITVSVERISSVGGRCVDTVARLRKADTLVGTNKLNATTFTTSDATVTYGGSSDLWGASWTAEDINAGGFGFDLSVNAGASGDTCNIDSVSVSIDYTPPAGTVWTLPATLTGMDTGAVFLWFGAVAVFFAVAFWPMKR